MFAGHLSPRISYLLDRALRPETRQAYFDAFGSDDDVNGLWNAATKICARLRSSQCAFVV